MAVAGNTWADAKGKFSLYYVGRARPFEESALKGVYLAC